MKILAIETSCDETAIAVLSFSSASTAPRVRIVANIVSSQAALHASFGGVVPNLAKREHQKNLVPILLEIVKKSCIGPSQKMRQKTETFAALQKNIDAIFAHEPELLSSFNAYIRALPTPAIDAIAVTNGPGLAPALWVGVNFARALSLIWHIPLIPVNHMEGHLFSALLQKSRKNNSQFSIHNFQFPLLALLVSGGHTELVLIKGYGKYRLIGETLDDAAGEAFDKVARMLGLGYPGGPAIAEAAKFKDKKFNDFKIKLPRPMLNSNNFNFSFSGLKTAVWYLTRDLGAQKTKKLVPVIAREFQNAVADVLVSKTIRAAKEHKIKTLLLGGGVAANKLLRSTLTRETKKINTPLLMPNASLTGDNAVMIALAAFFSPTKKAWTRVHAHPNARL